MRSCSIVQRLGVLVTDTKTTVTIPVSTSNSSSLQVVLEANIWKMFATNVRDLFQAFSGSACSCISHSGCDGQDLKFG